MQVKAQKDEPTSAATALSKSSNSASTHAPPQSPTAKKLAVVRMDRNKETEIEVKKLQASSPPKNAPPPAAASATVPLPATSPTSSIGSSVASSSTSFAKASSSNQPDDNSSSDETKRLKSRERVPTGKRVSQKAGSGEKATVEKNLDEPTTNPPGPPPGSRKKDDGEAKGSNSGKDNDDEDFQHLEPHVHVAAGDKIRVFYKFDNIYEAKVKRVQTKDNMKWPRYFVHYQGWNARYDEWIKRSKIKENLSWSKDREVSDTDAASSKEDAVEPSVEPIEAQTETKPPAEKKKPGPKAVGGRTTPLKG